jgi:hypothetical protein
VLAEWGVVRRTLPVSRLASTIVRQDAVILGFQRNALAARDVGELVLLVADVAGLAV